MKKIIAFAVFALLSVATLNMSSCRKEENPNLTVPKLDHVFVIDVTDTTAVCKATIVELQGSTIDDYGACWDIAHNPTMALATSQLIKTYISQVDSFNIVSNLTGLTPGTTYYVRAYAKNDAGETYSAEVTFTTSTLSLPALAALGTIAPDSITMTTARSGGNIIYEGQTSVTARGICWSTTPSPTTALTTRTLDGTSGGMYVSQMTGLMPGTTYYVRAYATNTAGTAYGNQVSFTTAAPAIGAAYGGGKIAYVLQPGDPGYSATQAHGLIAALTDVSAAEPWGYYWVAGETEPTGAAGTAIGTGMANTTTIVTAVGPPPSGFSYAAYKCDTMTQGGNTDWHLPSKDELNALYTNRTAIGGFSASAYWTSSEDNDDGAWHQDFATGSQTAGFKSGGHRVRAVRGF